METNKPSVVSPARTYLVVAFDESHSPSSSLWRYAASEFFRAETANLEAHHARSLAQITADPAFTANANLFAAISRLHHSYGTAFALLALALDRTPSAQ